MSRREERARGIANAEMARAELYDTLGQLRDRLNYAKRFDDATARLTARIEEQRRERPLAFAAGVVLAAATAGAVVWAVAKGVAKRFD